MFFTYPSLFSFRKNASLGEFYRDFKVQKKKIRDYGYTRGIVLGDMQISNEYIKVGCSWFEMKFLYVLQCFFSFEFVINASGAYLMFT